MSEDPKVIEQARLAAIKESELSSKEREDLQKWLESSEEHRAAFAEARREWASLEFLKSLRFDDDASSKHDDAPSKPEERCNAGEEVRHEQVPLDCPERHRFHSVTPADIEVPRAMQFLASLLPRRHREHIIAETFFDYRREIAERLNQGQYWRSTWFRVYYIWAVFRIFVSVLWNPQKKLSST